MLQRKVEGNRSIRKSPLNAHVAHELMLRASEARYSNRESHLSHGRTMPVLGKTMENPTTNLKQRRKLCDRQPVAEEFGTFLELVDQLAETRPARSTENGKSESEVTTRRDEY